VWQNLQHPPRAAPERERTMFIAEVFRARARSLSEEGERKDGRHRTNVQFGNDEKKQRSSTTAATVVQSATFNSARDVAAGGGG
jgi:hypothetical protein